MPGQCPERGLGCLLGAVGAPWLPENMSEGNNCPQWRLGSGGLGSGAVMGVQSGRAGTCRNATTVKAGQPHLGGQ